MDKLTELEYLEVTTPRFNAIIDAIKGNTFDLHPEDSFYLLAKIHNAVGDLKDTAFFNMTFTNDS